MMRKLFGLAAIGLVVVILLIAISSIQTASRNMAAPGPGPAVRVPDSPDSPGKMPYRPVVNSEQAEGLRGMMDEQLASGAIHEYRCLGSDCSVYLDPNQWATLTAEDRETMLLAWASFFAVEHEESDFVMVKSKFDRSILASYSHRFGPDLTP